MSYHRDITTDDVTVEDDDVTVEDDDVKVYMTRRLQSTYQSDFQSEVAIEYCWSRDQLACDWSIFVQYF